MRIAGHLLADLRSIVSSSNLTFLSDVYMVSFMKNFSRASLIATAVLIVALPLRAGDLDALERVIGRWMAVREAVAIETRAWHEQAATWQHEIDLMRRERDTLTEHLDVRQAARRETTDTLASLDATIADLQARLQALAPTVTALEDHLRAMHHLIPAPLAPELADGLRALATDTAPVETGTIVRRTQRALGLMADLERFQNTLHSGRETVTLDGTRRELRVLYLGLGQAYGVAPDGSRAAIATPALDGWTWQRADGIAEAVNAAIAILDRETPARFVTLPMQVAL